MKVFISYKSDDVNKIRIIVDILKGNGINVWFAEYEIISKHYDQIEREIKSTLNKEISFSNIAILFTNKKWFNSSYCKFEFEKIHEKFRADKEFKIIQICYPIEKKRIWVQKELSCPTINLNEDNFFEVIDFVCNTIGITPYRFLKKHHQVKLLFGSINLFETLTLKEQESSMLYVNYQGNILGVDSKLEVKFNILKDQTQLINYKDYWGLLNSGNRSAYRELISQAQIFLHNEKANEIGLHIYQFNDTPHLGLTYFKYNKHTITNTQVGLTRLYSIMHWDEQYSLPIGIIIKFSILTRNMTLKDSKILFHYILPNFDQTVCNSFQYYAPKGLKNFPTKEKTKTLTKYATMIYLTLWILAIFCFVEPFFGTGDFDRQFILRLTTISVIFIGLFFLTKLIILKVINFMCYNKLYEEWNIMKPSITSHSQSRK